jgi:hypothetical protein
MIFNQSITLLEKTMRNPFQRRDIGALDQLHRAYDTAAAEGREFDQLAWAREHMTPRQQRHFDRAIAGVLGPRYGKSVLPVSQVTAVTE